MNKPDRSRQRERERALFLYFSALERGDFDTVIAVLGQAEHDPLLDQMIAEVAELVEEPLPRPERRKVSLLHRSKGIMQVVIRRDPSPDGWPQKPDQSEEESDMFTTFTPARPYPEARKLNFDPITLVAVLLVLIILGAILLFMRIDSLGSVGGPQPDYASAIQTLTPVPTPDDPCAALGDLMAAGQIALDGGDYPAAIEAFTCTIEADPRNYEAYLGRAGAYLLSGDMRQSEHDYYLVAVEDIGVLDEALARYTRAIEANPDDITAYILRLYPEVFTTGSALRGGSDIERILELDPSWAPGYTLRGWANGQVGRRQQMSDDFARAVELAPDNTTLYWWTALAYIQAREPDSALEYINRAIDLAPQQGENYLMRADAYILAGEDSLAAADFARGVELIETERVVQNVQPGEATTLAMAEGRVYRLEFQARAGQRVTIGAARTPRPQAGPYSSAVLALLAEDGTPLVGAQDYHESPQTYIDNYIIPADGTYTLLVTSVIPFPDNEISVKVTLKD